MGSTVQFQNSKVFFLVFAIFASASLGCGGGTTTNDQGTDLAVDASPPGPDVMVDTAADSQIGEDNAVVPPDAPTETKDAPADQTQPPEDTAVDMVAQDVVVSGPISLACEDSSECSFPCGSGARTRATGERALT